MDYHALLRQQALTINHTATRARRATGLERFLAARHGILLIQQLRQGTRQAAAEGVTVTIKGLDPLERILEMMIQGGLAQTARQFYQLIDGTPENDPLRIAATQFLTVLLERHNLGSDDVGGNESGVPAPD